MKTKILYIGISILIILMIFFIVSALVNKKEISENKKEIEQATKPYLPTGFAYVEETNVETGLTIEDNSGNQYVWVVVPQTIEVYITAGLDITEFTDEEYELIENDLKTYTSAYSDYRYSDTYYSDETTGLTEMEYDELKETMLKSVYKNGGFYIGKYETGIDDNYRTENGNTRETPVIKANAYIYNYVTCSQAQNLASSMESGEYTSSLMFCLQWDLVLKYLETSGVATQSELNDNSTNWGNYSSNLCPIVNTNAKYSTDKGKSWTEGTYESEDDALTREILLSTGASETFCKQGIYDFAGNVSEWTLGSYSAAKANYTKRSIYRGGHYNNFGWNFPANFWYFSGLYRWGNFLGFRVALY